MSTLWDIVFPSFTLQDALCNMIFRDKVLKSNFSNEYLPENTLINDLWSIVLDYINYYRPMDMSIRVDAFATQIMNNRFQLNQPYWYLKYIQGPMILYFPHMDMWFRISEIPLNPHKLCVTPPQIVSNHPNKRFIVRICLGEIQYEPEPVYWTWVDGKLRQFDWAQMEAMQTEVHGNVYEIANGCIRMYKYGTT